MSSDHLARDRTIRVHIDATATRPPGRRRTWTVEARPWRADGASEQEAVDALAERLRGFLIHYRTPIVLSFRGFTAVVSLELGDDYNALVFTEQVADPRGHIAYSGVAADSWEQMEAKARYNLVQRTTNWHDDSSVHEGAAYLRAGRGSDSGLGPKSCTAMPRGSAPRGRLTQPDVPTGTSGPASTGRSSPSPHRFRPA